MAGRNLGVVNYHSHKACRQLELLLAGVTRAQAWCGDEDFSRRKNNLLTFDEIAAAVTHFKLCVKLGSAELSPKHFMSPICTEGGKKKAAGCCFGG